MILLLLYILWICFSALEGQREAMYWRILGMTSVTPSIEHKLWTCTRMTIVAMIALGATTQNNNIFSLMIYILCLVLSFPFIHDGFYYLARHKLDNSIYPKGFWDQSTTSTAFLTKFNTPIFRTIYFAISLFLLYICVSNSL